MCFEDVEMRNGAGSLIYAVSIAAEHKLDVDKFDDRLMMQKGCFLLNHMGASPSYSFNMYIRGPYSSELADDNFEINRNRIPLDGTDVDADMIGRLSAIFGKGIPYTEAYATLVLAKKYNPRIPAEKVKDMVIGMKPHLKEEIEEASLSVL